MSWFTRKKQKLQEEIKQRSLNASFGLNDEGQLFIDCFGHNYLETNEYIVWLITFSKIINYVESSGFSEIEINFFDDAKENVLKRLKKKENEHCNLGEEHESEIRYEIPTTFGFKKCSKGYWHNIGDL
jgi:hypothetical protein